jgi:hypothetical protein
VPSTVIVHVSFTAGVPVIAIVADGPLAVTVPTPCVSSLSKTMPPVAAIAPPSLRTRSIVVGSVCGTEAV